MPLWVERNLCFKNVNSYLLQDRQNCANFQGVVKHQGVIKWSIDYVISGDVNTFVFPWQLHFMRKCSGM